MAYFDENDPIRNQLAERFKTTGLGPTITVDPVTGETSLGAKKNPTSRDWQKAYEGYIGKGGSFLNTPTGSSATRMYQHPIFKGRGLSYYSSEPYRATFIDDMQKDIAEKDVAATTPATSVGQLKRREEELYSDTEGGSPPGDPAPSDWDIASGPELFQEEVPALSGRYSDPFSIDPSKTAANVAFQKAGQAFGVGKLASVIGLGITGYEVLKSIFGENYYEKAEKELLEKDIWTQEPPTFTRSKAPSWGDFDSIMPSGPDTSPGAGSPDEAQDVLYGGGRGGGMHPSELSDTAGGSVGGGAPSPGAGSPDEDQDTFYGGGDTEGGGGVADSSEPGEVGTDNDEGGYGIF